MSGGAEARKPFYRRLYEGWMVIAGHFGETQTLVVLGLCYVLVIGPVSIVMSRKDPLHKRALRSQGSAWLDADSTLPDLERARRLF
jgi:hypothetical protein